MRIDADGRKTAHRFGRGIMRSAARLTYEQVQKAADEGSDLGLGEGHVARLYGAFRALLAARERRGTLDLDLPERKVVLDARGKVLAVVPRPRLDSHQTAPFLTAQSPASPVSRSATVCPTTGWCPTTMTVPPRSGHPAALSSAAGTVPVPASAQETVQTTPRIVTTNEPIVTTAAPRGGLLSRLRIRNRRMNATSTTVQPSTVEPAKAMPTKTTGTTPSTSKVQQAGAVEAMPVQTQTIEPRQGILGRLRARLGR